MRPARPPLRAEALRRIGEKQAVHQRKHILETIAQIRDGKIDSRSRMYLSRYYLQETRRGTFTGTIREWLDLHGIKEMPPGAKAVKKAIPKQDQDAPEIEQETLDAVLEIDGWPTLCILLLARTASMRRAG